MALIKKYIYKSFELHPEITIFKLRSLIAGLTGLVIIFFYSCQPAKEQYYFDVLLNSGWKLRKSGEEQWLSAYVPGNIASDLFLNKKISDPFIHNHVDSLRWISATSWEYQNIFLVAPDILRYDSVYLLFKGFSGNASVYLNDSLILVANNVFRSWKVDCKALLKETDNKLRIIFHPVNKQSSAFFTSGTFSNPGCKFVTQSMYSSYTLGICRGVYLQAWSVATIDDLYLYPEQIIKKRADYNLHYTISSSENQNVNIELLINNEPVKPVESVKLIKGLNHQKTSFSIENPKLWWSNGLGNPHLYNFTLRVKKEQKVINERKLRLGVRTIEWAQQPDSLGYEMRLMLNGIPVFIKGVTYTPKTIFPVSAIGEHYRKVIEDARLSNINTFWMSKGDMQANDVFYDFCDENGIMVCKDLALIDTMLAPKNANFEDIRQAVHFTVKDLRNHACLSLWYRGNIEEQQRQLQLRNKSGKLTLNKQEALFQMLPDLIKNIDQQTDYWNSDRTAQGLENKAHSFNIKNKVRKYTVFEGEKLSLPTLQTLQIFMSSENISLKPEEARSQTSKYKLLGYPRDVTKIILDGIIKDYKYPKDLESFIYLSQLVQADIIKNAIEYSRKNWSDCTGWTYPKFNDCFPSISGSTIDYFGRWKPAQYALKNSFTHFLVIPIRENNTVKIYGVSDAFRDMEAILLTKLIDFQGKVLYVKQIPITLKTGNSNLLLTVREPEMLKNAVRNRCCLIVQLNGATTTLSQNVLYFTEPKNLLLSKSKPTVDVNETGKGFHVILKSDQLMKNVCLETKAKASYFSDNNFDLLPEKRTKIMVQYTGTKAELLNDLVIRSLVDVN